MKLCAMLVMAGCRSPSQLCACTSEYKGRVISIGEMRGMTTHTAVADGYHGKDGELSSGEPRPREPPCGCDCCGAWRKYHKAVHH
jgi:hypothetical protein